MGVLLGSLGSLDGLDQLGNDLEQVTHDTVISHLEDGSGIVLVHSDDALGVLHTSLVLDSAGDAQSDVNLGVNGLTGLAHLVVSSDPAGIHAGAAGTNHAAQNLGQLLGQLDALFHILADAAAHGHDEIGANQVNQLLGSLHHLHHLGLDVGGGQLESGMDDFHVLLALTLLHNAGAHSGHGGTETGAEDGGHQVTADKSVCYVDCDLMGCVNTKQLMAAYPDRAYEAGIAEANAAGVCAGLAATGKKVYLHTFGTFASRRIYDQIYMSAAYADLPVHVFGSDAGVCAAFNGGTHMPLEDAAMYLSIPKAVVTDPCDYAQLKAVTEQVADCDCVTYTRFVRKDIIRVYGDDTEFTLGKGVVLHESSHDAATIITSGIMVDEALKAYEALDAEGIAVRVVDMFTWKPLDEELVLRCAAETGAIVTAENHNVVCGLGSAVANCLAKNHPTVQEFVGVQDMFGQVGPQSFLMDEYGLRASNIVAAEKKAIGRK